MSKADDIFNELDRHIELGNMTRWRDDDKYLIHVGLLRAVRDELDRLRKVDAAAFYVSQYRWREIIADDGLSNCAIRALDSLKDALAGEETK